MNPGDIVLAFFPMAGAGGRKLRPALVLTGPLGSVPEFVVAYVSSVIPPTVMTSDIVIDPSLPEFASTKLKAVSILRLHKLATIHNRDAVRLLGQLTPASLQDVQSKLKVLFGL